MVSNKSAIAVYDSGIGGLNFLKKAITELPNENFIYYGDLAYAPYGDREAGEVILRGETVIDILLSYDVKAIVIACNTATSVAVSHLREKYPHMFILGMEPAVKKGALWAEENNKENIVILATTATIKGKKLQKLIDEYSDKTNIIKLACPGLMDIIEEEATESVINEYFTKNIDPVVEKYGSNIVLGCTHYIFLRQYIEKRYENSQIFDGDEGTLRYLKRLLYREGLLNDNVENIGKIEVLTSSPDKQGFLLKADKILKNEETRNKI